MKKLVEIKNLSVKFPPDKLVLDNLSLSINEGELISLIGLNGSGKTTLVKAIAGLIKPSKGEIKRFTDKIFYIPQKSDLDTSFPITIRELFALFGRKPYEEYLKQVGMLSFLDRQVGKLSGGELQRVFIALALSNKPDLLLMDEPISGIDVVAEKSFYEMIERIRKDYEMSIVLVSHDIHVVIAHADKVWCLAGHICCQGPPAEVASSKEFLELFMPHLQPYKHKHDHVHK